MDLIFKYGVTSSRFAVIICNSSFKAKWLRGCSEYYSGDLIAACTMCCRCITYESIAIGVIIRQYRFGGGHEAKNALSYIYECSITPHRLYSLSTLAGTHVAFLLSYCRNLASSTFSYSLGRL